MRTQDFISAFAKEPGSKFWGPYIIRKDVWESHPELHYFLKNTQEEDGYVMDDLINAYCSISFADNLMIDPEHPNDLLAEVLIDGDVFVFRRPLGGNEFYEAEVYIMTMHEYLHHDYDEDNPDYGWDDEAGCGCDLIKHVATDWETVSNLPAVINSSND